MEEMYSKVCVAGSLKFVTGEKKEEKVVLNESEKFSRHLATILARDREMVAVGTRIFSDIKCIVYISKSRIWNKKDVEYINNYMKS